MVTVASEDTRRVLANSRPSSEGYLFLILNHGAAWKIADTLLTYVSGDATFEVLCSEQTKRPSRVGMIVYNSHSSPLKMEAALVHWSPLIKYRKQGKLG